MLSEQQGSSSVVAPDPSCHSCAPHPSSPTALPRSMYSTSYLWNFCKLFSQIPRCHRSSWLCELGQKHMFVWPPEYCVSNSQCLSSAGVPGSTCTLTGERQRVSPVAKVKFVVSRGMLYMISFLKCVLRWLTAETCPCFLNFLLQSELPGVMWCLS